MGIYLFIKDGNAKESYSCSYSFWNELRCLIVKCTFDHISTILDNYNHLQPYVANWKQYKPFVITPDQYISTSSFNFTEYNNAVIFFNKIITPLCRTNNFDDFKQVNLYGIIPFINQSDCDGYYSLGNVCDFIVLLDTIKPQIDAVFTQHPKIFEQFNDSLTQLNDLFNEAMSLKKGITIA